MFTVNPSIETTVKEYNRNVQNVIDLWVDSDPRDDWLSAFKLSKHD